MHTKTDRSIKITKKQFDLIIGTTMGDGTLTKSRNKRKTASVRFTHSYKQEAYCRCKGNILDSMSNHGCELKTYYVKDRGVDYTTCRYTSIYTKEIYNLYDMFYSNGVKIITEEICKTFNPMILAYWYMDDGSIEVCKQKRNGKLHYIGNRLNFHTNCFSIPECELMAKTLNDKFGLSFRIKELGGKNTGQTILQTKSRKSIESFIKIIEPFVIPEMQYKLKCAYTKPMRKTYTDNQILRMVKILHPTRRKDLIKYKRGVWLYEAIRYRFGSIENAIKEL